MAALSPPEQHRIGQVIKFVDLLFVECQILENIIKRKSGKRVLAGRAWQGFKQKKFGKQKIISWPPNSFPTRLPHRTNIIKLIKRKQLDTKRMDNAAPGQKMQSGFLKSPAGQIWRWLWIYSAV
jgi:hypothetical protein